MELSHFNAIAQLSGMLRHAMHLVLPVRCAVCAEVLTDDPVPFFCRSCWEGLKPLTGPSCPRCHRPFASEATLLYSPQHHCRTCRLRPPVYTEAWSLYPYVPPLQQALHLFKYKRKAILVSTLGTLLRHGTALLPPVDLLMPIPLHVSRLREREFNQSLLLADQLNRNLGLPLSYDNLVRIQLTVPQTDLPRKARLNNLRKAFALARPQDVKDKSILLVDDVFTTGTTINECAKTLRKAGAANVYGLTLARTL
jgi:ComF family protein